MFHRDARRNPAGVGPRPYNSRVPATPERPGRWPGFRASRSRAPVLFAADPTEPFTVWTVVGLVSIPLLVAVNGFFVAAEFALVAIRKTRVEELVNLGRSGAQSLMDAVENLNRSVAACQLGITVASLALGFVSEPAIHRLIHPLFATLPAELQGPFSRVLSVLLTLSLITYLHVVFGEQAPKIAALQSPEAVGLWVARPVNVF